MFSHQRVKPIRPSVRHFIASMLTLISATAMAGPLHKGKIETTVNLSQGYRHGDTIFFLADIHRYQRGRTFWFILPFEAGPKTQSHRTLLYSLKVGSRALTMEAVLADPAELTCSVANTKWILMEGGLFIAYNPSNRICPETGHAEWAVFRRDMATGKVAAVPEPEKAQAELFAAYRSPYRDNPGIVEISDYQGMLPPGWPDRH